MTYDGNEKRRDDENGAKGQLVMADLPIAVMAGRRVYDNTPTTVFVLAHNATRELLVIRRAKQPGYGLFGLPGGY